MWACERVCLCTSTCMVANIIDSRSQFSCFTSPLTAYVSRVFSTHTLHKNSFIKFKFKFSWNILRFSFIFKTNEAILHCMNERTSFFFSIHMKGIQTSCEVYKYFYCHFHVQEAIIQCRIFPFTIRCVLILKKNLEPNFRKNNLSFLGRRQWKEKTKIERYNSPEKKNNNNNQQLIIQYVYIWACKFGNFIRYCICSGAVVLHTRYKIEKKLWFTSLFRICFVLFTWLPFKKFR